MTKIIFKSNLSLSNIILLTAAIRDLHKTYPNQFLTDMRTAYPAIWENNPYVTPLDEAASDVIMIALDMPLINRSNELPYHTVHSFIEFFNNKLKLQVRSTAFRGDIYISNLEKQWISQVAEIAGADIPFWIIVAGGKHDHTIKWWDIRRFQQIIDHFKDRIQFVHVGAVEHHHPELKGVIDLRGRTDMRALIRLVYHAQGVLCPVTSLMHLAAAVEIKPGLPKNRPCVVVAGGRESVQREAYPYHQYIHTIGTLLCCENGGCWRSRTVPLGDGSIRDRPEHLCVDVVRNLPRCMDVITSNEVTRRIETYFEGGIVTFLSKKQVHIAHKAVAVGQNVNWIGNDVEAYSFRRASDTYIKQIASYPLKQFQGEGILICAGQLHLPSTWVCIRMLRKLGCSLPIEVWHLGRDETDEQIERLLKVLHVKCIDVSKLIEKRPTRKLGGWLLKAYAIIYSKFQEVLLLEADNLPVVNPQFLFETPQYKQTGAIFWPDIRPGIAPEVWKLFGIPYSKEPEFESGQIVVDKRRCWHALCLALWYDEHADFYYQHILGDKDTFHMAFRKLRKTFSWVTVPAEKILGVICQHDFTGRRIFQHRHIPQWRLVRNNPSVPGFLYESECREFLGELRFKWHTPPPQLIVPDASTKTDLEQQYFNELTSNCYEYMRKRYDARRMSFNSNGSIGLGSSENEKHWHLTHLGENIWLEILSDHQVICRLKPDAHGNWRGRWNYHEKMAVSLTRERVKSNGFSNHHHSVLRRRILFRAPLNGYTGYGLHASQIVTDLQGMGYEFTIRAIDINETFAPIPMNVRKTIIAQEHPGEWELVLCPPGFAPQKGKKTVHFTMWETSKLSPHAVLNLNRCQCVIVPTAWNASAFYDSGVKVPIHIVPLGINTNVFQFRPMDMQGACIFGTAGRLESGGIRKGINLVIDSFKKSFPTQKDVYLYVKIFPDCDVPFESDSRIRFNREYFSEEKMAAWFQKLTCFVSGARGEGWGLMQHQALATGRPIISVRFGGTAEFFKERMGYPLDFRLVPAKDLYSDCGLWAEPDEKHLIQLMRQVYRKREQAQKLGLNAAHFASKLTWQESSKKLKQVLQKVGLID